MDDLYDFEVKNEPGTRTSVYVAKIVGEDPHYTYRREFVPVERRTTEDGCRYEPELDDYGVYERSVKWFEDKPGGRFLGKTQHWYLVFDCGAYRIPPWTVTYTWKWLSRFLAEGGAAA